MARKLLDVFKYCQVLLLKNLYLAYPRKSRLADPIAHKLPVGFPGRGMDSINCFSRQKENLVKESPWGF